MGYRKCNQCGIMIEQEKAKKCNTCGNIMCDKCHQTNSGKCNKCNEEIKTEIKF